MAFHLVLQPSSPHLWAAWWSSNTHHIPHMYIQYNGHMHIPYTIHMYANIISLLYTCTLHLTAKHAHTHIHTVSHTHTHTNTHTVTVTHPHPHTHTHTPYGSHVQLMLSVVGGVASVCQMAVSSPPPVRERVCNRDSE